MSEINKETIEILKSTVDDLVLKMGVSVNTLARIDEREGQEVVCLNIEAGDEANHLIGQRGSNLFALQYLVKVFLKRRGKIEIPFYIDVNNYRKEKEEYLQTLANNTAEKAVRINKEIVLQPMMAYERRIVHLCLKEDERVETESVGEEPNRRLTVKLLNS